MLSRMRCSMSSGIPNAPVWSESGGTSHLPEQWHAATRNCPFGRQGNFSGGFGSCITGRSGDLTGKKWTGKWRPEERRAGRRRVRENAIGHSASRPEGRGAWEPFPRCHQRAYDSPRVAHRRVREHAGPRGSVKRMGHGSSQATHRLPALTGRLGKRYNIPSPAASPHPCLSISSLPACPKLPRFKHRIPLRQGRMSCAPCPTRWGPRRACCLPC